MFQTNHVKRFSPSQNYFEHKTWWIQFLKQRTWSKWWSNWGKFLLSWRLKDQWEFSLINWQHPQYNATINHVKNWIKSNAQFKSNALDTTISLNADNYCGFEMLNLSGGSFGSFWNTTNATNSSWFSSEYSILNGMLVKWNDMTIYEAMNLLTSTASEHNSNCARNLANPKNENRK